MRGVPSCARPLVAALAAFMLVATGCGGPAPLPRPSGDVIIYAASSLTEVFTEIGGHLESAHPGLRVSFSFGASNVLALQVNAGARADVFAAASPETMRLVTDAGNASGEPTVFARNQLVIAVAKGNPTRVASLDDLARVTVALCREQVPCGDAARRLLAAAGVSVTPASQAEDVKAALRFVIDGAADAALVYRSDARIAESQVDTVEIIESVQEVNDCQIAVLKQAQNPQAAQAFVEYVASERGMSVMGRVGFQDPT